MIGHLAGVVAERDQTSVVVDVHGVGYVVHVAPSMLVPPRGAPIALHVHLHVREDALTLYGFVERSAKMLFELLLGSSGVGPRLALAALGSIGAERVATAIAAGDIATLTEIPGVGRKVAERLVLDLQDRIGSVVPAADGTTASAGSGGDAVSALDEVRDALAGLGYQPREIDDAVADATVADAADVPAMLRAALRMLGSRR